MIGTIMSVHNALYVNVINTFGTKQQKEKFLPGYTDGTFIGCFALSEPELVQNPSPESDSEEDKPSCTFTTKSMTIAFHRIQEGLQMLADEDPDVERSARVYRTVMEGLTRYQEIYNEKKCAAKQPTIRAFFQPVADMVTHEGDKIMSVILDQPQVLLLHLSQSQRSRNPAVPCYPSLRQWGNWLMSQWRHCVPTHDRVPATRVTVGVRIESRQRESRREVQQHESRWEVG
uniref:Acyl-CoA dehydrogenase/oxidase N-terminal domain-containing protein n=1 Tax=Timema cristinae TaxID=61476 RepID=A0A7R9GWL0_TIMCR|nr:unnamed protein product [Timema cristinae]